MKPSVPSPSARDLSALTGRVTKAPSVDPAAPAASTRNTGDAGNASSASMSPGVGVDSDSGVDASRGSTGIGSNASSTRSAGSTGVVGGGGERTKVTVYMPLDLAERARSAWRQSGTTPGTVYLSFSGWVSQAIERAVLEAERDLNEGRPFAPTPAGVSPTGRPPRC